MDLDSDANLKIEVEIELEEALAGGRKGTIYYLSVGFMLTRLVK